MSAHNIAPASITTPTRSGRPPRAPRRPMPKRSPRRDWGPSPPRSSRRRNAISPRTITSNISPRTRAAIAGSAAPASPARSVPASKPDASAADASDDILGLGEDGVGDAVSAGGALGENAVDLHRIGHQ